MQAAHGSLMHHLDAKMPDSTVLGLLSMEKYRTYNWR
jgi:hypothetical protein